MKKIVILLAAVTMFLGVSAQSEMPTSEMMKQFRQTVQKRDISKRHLESNIPLSNTVTSSKGMKSLPSGRVWFPGEWEEVQAIVVTPYYYYEPDPTPGSGYWAADPILPGVAQYYKYAASGQWIEQGMGPYKAIMETTEAFSKVAFYLMDAIQIGGAQAWVRVEQWSDTTLVIQKLTQMGLHHDNMRFIMGPGNSFWYRDCGPICFYYGDQDSVGMLDFTYYPGRALDDMLPSLIHQQAGIPNYQTLVEWEGGNCVVDGAGMVFSSDALYENNMDTYGQLTWDGTNYSSINYSQVPAMTRAQVKQALHDMLGQRATYILPAYQYDGGTGHVDLYADMWDENGFVFSKMPSQYSSWVDYQTGLKNIDSLCSYKSAFNRDYYEMGQIPFPSKDNGSNFSSQVDYNRNYTRTYSNHTFVNNLIMQPCFSAVGSNGLPTAAWDRANVEELKKAYPGYTIYCVDVREFDGSGGAIHCITKQIPAENPVRILHKNIHGCANDMQGQDVPVSAIITNRSGISHAEVVYRVDGGNWQTMNLTANGNRWSGKFPAVTVANDTVVDTVITADTNYNVIDSTIAGIDTSYTTDSVMVLDTLYTYTYDTVVVFDTAINSHVLDVTVNVEYYISATSNNGKTITKPMTASQGGYYTFHYTNMPDGAPALDSTMYDFDTLAMPDDNITFTFGSSWVTEEVDDDPVGITEVNVEENFGQFYPNPATERADMRIELGDGASYNVTVFDQSGRTVHTSSLQAAGSIVYSINASRLTAGMYTVVFSNGSESVARKLVVK